MALLRRRAVFAVMITPGWDKLCFGSDNRIRLPRGVGISQTQAPPHGTGHEEQPVRRIRAVDYIG